MKKENSTKLIALIGVVIVALIIVIIFFINKVSRQNEQLETAQVFMEEQKQNMEKEIEQISGDMEGFSFTIHNDSLLQEFDLQKQKIKDLQNELKNTKATDAKRIAELKGEIETLRKILAHYVEQIDSLNSLNQRLMTENEEVKQQYQSVAATADILAKEKETLTETVSRAAILEAYNIQTTCLDSRERKTKRASKIKTFKITFTIGKNITAEPGIKTVYLRLTRPDEELMTQNSETFTYEGSQIGFSAKKEIEYGGEAIDEVMYWNVDEILQLGNYHVDLFADGNRIASHNFRLEKN